MHTAENQPRTPVLPHPAAEQERRMRHRIFVVSLIVMAAVPAFVGWGLSGLSAYIDNDVAVYAPSALITAVSYALSILISLFSMLYQYAGFGVLGYSVMRYGVRKSAPPIVLSVVCALITFAGNIGVLFYIYGVSAIRNNLAYFLPIWILTFFLALFTCFCVIFLCAMLRASFRKTGRLSVSVSFSVRGVREDRDSRRRNVLRRLYLWITGLLFFFNFVSSALGTFAELRQLGAPETVWDWYTLLEPYIQLLLYSAAGYFVQLAVGRYLTEADREIGEKVREEQDAERNRASQTEILNQDL